MHAFLTGASAGIGEALARRLSLAGYDLTLVARRKEQLERVAQSLPGNTKATVRAADVSDLEGLRPLVLAAEADLGPIDALINNAGVQIVKRTTDVSVEESEKLFTIDVLAPFRLTQAVLGGMVARGKGIIVDIASLAALAPTPGMVHYNAAKAALAAASESLRVEVAPAGVHVVTVYPGPVKTAMADAALAAYGDNPAANGLPVGTTEDLAHKVVAAMHDGTHRVIYPAGYAVARHFPALTRWILDRFSPMPAASDPKT